jgi:hypothetical protein
MQRQQTSVLSHPFSLISSLSPVLSHPFHLSSSIPPISDKIAIYVTNQARTSPINRCFGDMTILFTIAVPSTMPLPGNPGLSGTKRKKQVDSG